MNIISMEDFYGYFSEMLYILQYFNLNFILFFNVKYCRVYNYCPTSPSRLVRKLWTSVKGHEWQIKMEYVLFLKILSIS